MVLYLKQMEAALMITITKVFQVQQLHAMKLGIGLQN
jgi:hypothetical protein